jgi:hypothetical protein
MCSRNAPIYVTALDLATGNMTTSFNAPQQ